MATRITAAPWSEGFSTDGQFARITLPTASGAVEVEFPAEQLGSLTRLAMRLEQRAAELHGGKFAADPQRLNGWRLQISDTGQYCLRVSPVGGGQVAVWTSWEVMADMKEQLSEALRIGRKQ